MVKSALNWLFQINFYSHRNHGHNAKTEDSFLRSVSPPENSAASCAALWKAQEHAMDKAASGWWTVGERTSAGPPGIPTAVWIHGSPVAWVFLFSMFPAEHRFQEPCLRKRGQNPSTSCIIHVTLYPEPNISFFTVGVLYAHFQKEILPTPFYIHVYT